MNEILIALLVPFGGIVLGSAFVFFVKDAIPARVQKLLLGFAAGVMVSASVWSLLIPSMEYYESSGKWAVVPCAFGFLAGMLFLLLIDMLTPHLHAGQTNPEGPKSRLSRTAMLMLAVTIHHIPEGMAIGAVVAGVMQGVEGITAASVLAMSVGIAIQNIPEGAVISLPLRLEGKSKGRSFLIGCATGFAQPFGVLLIILLADVAVSAMGILLAFAAGAMLYVVVEELIPEASDGEHSNLSTIGFSVGFVIMLVLDVLLG